LELSAPELVGKRGRGTTLAEEHKRRQMALEPLKDHSVISTTVLNDCGLKGPCSTYSDTLANIIQDSLEQLEAQVSLTQPPPPSTLKGEAGWSTCPR